jgi:serine/threonine protein kinase
LKKLQKKAYAKKQASSQERTTRENEYKTTISEFLVDNKEKRDKRPRRMSCQVMSRWYRAPEVILTCENYGQEGDIYSMGLILVEMIYCSTTYHKDPDFDPRNRYMFQGNACFPISPFENEGLTKNDQLIKLLEKMKINPEKDFSFLSNEEEEGYTREAH